MSSTDEYDYIRRLIGNTSNYIQSKLKSNSYPNPPIYSPSKEFVAEHMENLQYFIIEYLKQTKKEK